MPLSMDVLVTPVDRILRSPAKLCAVIGILALLITATVLICISVSKSKKK